MPSWGLPSALGNLLPSDRSWGDRALALRLLEWLWGGPWPPALLPSLPPCLAGAPASPSSPTSPTIGRHICFLLTPGKGGGKEKCGVAAGPAASLRRATESGAGPAPRRPPEGRVDREQELFSLGTGLALLGDPT